MSLMNWILMLALAVAMGWELSRTQAQFWQKMLGFSMLLALAALIYTALGRPDLPDQPYSGRDQLLRLEEEWRWQELAHLRQVVQEQPDSAQAHIDLAWHLMQMGRHERALSIWQDALALEDISTEERVQMLSGLGAAESEANQGIVTETALAYFAQALALHPQDHLARSYQGLARLQAGDTESAIEIWQALLDDHPPTAPWHEALRQKVEQLRTDPSLSTE